MSLASIGILTKWLVAWLSIGIRNVVVDLWWAAGTVEYISEVVRLSSSIQYQHSGISRTNYQSMNINRLSQIAMHIDKHELFEA